MTPAELAARLVKPLVWEDDGSHRYIATAGVETLIVADMWRAVRGSGFSYKAGNFPTLAAAQAAAEADHRSRVLAALDLAQVVALVVAASDVIQRWDDLHGYVTHQAISDLRAALSALKETPNG
jgi:hypothetical protein